MANFSLSTASIAAALSPVARNATNITLADLTGPGAAPQALLDNQLSTIQSVLRYPSDLPPYYFKLAVSDYKRDTWLSVGQLVPSAWIALPLPQSMVDEHQVSYDTEPLTAAGNAILQATKAAVNSGMNMGALQAAVGSLGNNAPGIAAQIAASLAGPTPGRVLAAAGAVINEFMTVMLKGPSYKRRQFVWKFSPKNAAESATLRAIIQRLNNSAAPGINGLVGSAFFSWPQIFQPSFQFGSDVTDGSLGNILGDWTFYMKRSVLESCVFNYTPNNQWASFGATKAPASIEMRLQFLELEFWLKDQYVLGNNPTLPNEAGTLRADLLKAIRTESQATTPVPPINTPGGGAPVL
jgi:hypothetical protein